MKSLIAVLLATAALSGCAVVPYEPGPVVYAAPPAVVVAPRPYYYGYRHYGGYYRRPYWR